MKKYLLTISLLFSINILIGQKIIPTITWNTPADITYGTPISLTQLNATSNVPGNFYYNPTIGDVLGAGQQLLSLDFVPDDTATYQSLRSITTKIMVNKATATLSFRNLNQRYDGNKKTVDVITSPENMQTSVLYNNTNIAPILAGNYVVTAILNNGNYTATSITDTLKIVATSGSIKISNLSQQYAPNTPKPVTVITNPAGLAFTTTYNGSSIVPINPGSYQVISTIQDSVYQGADTQTLIINKSVPIINWSNPASIAYGTSLSNLQLNYSTNTDGRWENDLTGTILNVGQHVLFIKFIPSDTNFLSSYKTVNLIVNKSIVSLSVSNLNQNYNGFKREVQVTPADIYGTKTTYSGLDSAIVSGTYNTLTTLTNENFVATSSISKTLTINKGTPIITWNAIKPVYYGSILSSYQLNATSSVAGSFSYFPTAGSFIQPGNTTIYAIFTPSDNNYNSVSTSNVISSSLNSEYPQYFYSRTIKLY